MSNEQKPFTAHSFQQFLDQGQLMASRCKGCEQTYLPPRALCPECAQTDLEWIELQGNGKLVAFTSVYIGPSFMNDQGFSRVNPYLTGIVELETGSRISARLLGFDASHPDTVKIGSPLKFTTVEILDGEETRAQLAFQLAE